MCILKLITRVGQLRKYHMMAQERINKRILYWCGYLLDMLDIQQISNDNRRLDLDMQVISKSSDMP